MPTQHTEPSIDELLDAFDLTTLKPTTTDPAVQIARDLRAIRAARYHGHRTAAAIRRATSLSAFRYGRAMDAEVNAGPSEMELRDAKIRKAFDRGLKTASSIRNHTGIGSDQVRSSAKRLGLNLSDGRPVSTVDPKVVHKRNVERRARERRRKADIEAVRGRR